MIWALFMYAGLVLGFTALINAREARRNAISAAQADSARSKAELSALRGKLNPHFLFNTLNTLIALTRKDAQRAEQNLIRFSGLLRHVLDNQRSGQDFCSVDQEVSFVRDYLELEKLRLGARLKVDWEVQPQALEARIPALGLQPLIENAIVHGIAPKINGGTIQITIKQVLKNAESFLAINICDDGMGCDLNDLKRSGLGVSAVKQRFELAYGDQLNFDMQSALNQGMRINIQIPFDLE
jgi:LytS/YehU family sensor histidine kinase